MNCTNSFLSFLLFPLLSLPNPSFCPLPVLLFTFSLYRCAPVGSIAFLTSIAPPTHTTFTLLPSRHLGSNPSHACVSSLSVLPPHGLHVFQSPAGPAAASLPQPREEPEQGGGLVQNRCPPQDHGSRTGGSSGGPRIREPLSN